MKHLPIFIALFILVESCGQVDNKTINISEREKQISIKGTWTISKYYFAQISGMDEKMASEWLNKQLIIDDTLLHFDFQKIEYYKDLFKNENVCIIKNLNNPEIAPMSEYFDTIRDPLKDLKLTNSSIKIYKTNCKDNPFSEFVLSDNNEIIIQWDGAFFLLTK